MGPDHLVDKREALRADPPDILLTNYKMLDFLLLRPEDRDPLGGQPARHAAVRGARRVPHLRRGAGHRRRHAAAPPRRDARDGNEPMRRSGRRRRWRPRPRSGPAPTRWPRCATFAAKVFGVDFDDASIDRRDPSERRGGLPDHRLPPPDTRRRRRSQTWTTTTMWSPPSARIRSDPEPVADHFVGSETGSSSTP